MDKMFGKKSKQPAKQTGLFGMTVKETKPDDEDMQIVETKQQEEKPKFTPWVEKYRPSKIDEVSHQMEVVSALRESIKTGQVPHLLMYGPPGTGKTSTVLAMAKELFGKEFYKHRILELNASDERGIQVVRDKIKKFAQRKIAHNPDKECPPLQLIILDEADSMTIDAQSALRRIIEAYSTNTRFCIICNYISKIIDPLASRCVKFRFSAIGADAQKQRLKMICEKENIKIESDQVIDSLIEISEGDLRRSINTLQTCSSFVKGQEQALTVSDIEKISGVVEESVIRDIYDQISQAQNYSEIHAISQNLILDGYDIQQLINKLNQFYISSRSVKDIQKARIAEVIADADFKMIQGGDEELNLLHTLSCISRIIKG